MIDHGTLLSIPFLKKSRFTGSDRGMRYSIYKVEETRVIPNDASEEAPKEEKKAPAKKSAPKKAAKKAPEKKKAE